MKRRFILKLFAATPIVGIPPIAAALTNPPTESIEYIGDVERVTLYADDTVVLTVDDVLSDATVAHIKHTLANVFPGHRVLVLGEGMKLGVLGAPHGN